MKLETFLFVVRRNDKPLKIHTQQVEGPKFEPRS
jgi:hypothetical protein